MSAAVVFWLLAGLAVTGAAVVALTRDVLRLVHGLGVFLLAVAGFFLYYAMPFLAVAQVLVYVGGVLVLVLFAIGLVQRDADGVLELGRDFDIGALSVSVGIALLLGFSLKDLPAPAVGAVAGVKTLGGVLLGQLLPAFELVGVLLLAALVAVLTIVAAEVRR